MRKAETIITLTCDKCTKVVPSLETIYTHAVERKFLSPNSDGGFAALADLCPPCRELLTEFLKP